jgi:prepilin-type processing-associated H-X9-DG protein
MTYLGSKIWQDGIGGCEKATRQSQVRNNTETVMFADTAMTKLDDGAAYYLEYSFVEPPYFLMNGAPKPSWGYASPSVHFRHGDSANIAWADGHVDKRQMTDFDGVNIYGVKSDDMGIGWFYPLNNTMFDLK